jgi:hypothetical protein
MGGHGTGATCMYCAGLERVERGKIREGKEKSLYVVWQNVWENVWENLWM